MILEGSQGGGAPAHEGGSQNFSEGGHGEDSRSPSPESPQRGQESGDYDRGEYYRQLESVRRKERDLIEARKRYNIDSKQREQESQRIRDLETRLSRYESIKERLAHDPHALLQAYDLDIDKFSQMVLNAPDGQGKEHFIRYDDELKKTKAELEEFKKKSQEWQEQQEDKELTMTKNNYLYETDVFIEKNAEKYPLLSEEPDRNELVFKTIEEHWINTRNAEGNGRYLSFDEACQIVDRALANQYMAALKSEKRRKALGISLQEEQQARQMEEDYQHRPSYSENEPRTLSNRYSNRGEPPQTKRFYTPEERHESMRRFLDMATRKER